VWSGGNCQNPINLNHACDDGSGGGNASVVSSFVAGANAAEKFQHAVNKKLACCLNSFDIASPAAPLKYDCVDNSTLAVTSFDALWEGADPADSGGQAYAVVLSSGGNGKDAGKPLSGFYTLAGARCDSFSEFAGPIRSATVNPGQSTTQQAQAGGSNDACKIVPGTYVANPPANLTSAMTAIGKTVPYDGSSTSNCQQAS
jgi:hypothetical protein